MSAAVGGSGLARLASLGEPRRGPGSPYLGQLRALVGEMAGEQQEVARLHHPGEPHEHGAVARQGWNGRRDRLLTPRPEGHDRFTTVRREGHTVGQLDRHRQSEIPSANPFCIHPSSVLIALDSA